MSTRRSRPPTANGETVDAHSRNGNTNGNGTLPPPNTYGQYKANQGKDEEKGLENPFKAGIKPAGESGRRGFHPWKFLRISFRSTSKASLVCNVLWPIVPAAIAVRCEFKSSLFIFAPVYRAVCCSFRRQPSVPLLSSQVILALPLWRGNAGS